jgi:gamma-glutamyl hercynylcysteine S-oxide synthase
VGVSATNDELRAALETARARTLALLEPVSSADQERQISPLMSPLCWDLGHVAHFEELWLLRTVAGTDATDARLDDVYDAFKHPRRDRPDLDLLGPAEAREFAADVRKRVLDVLVDIDLDSANRLLSDGFVYRMIVQHEHQHDETMLATIQLMDSFEYPRARQRAAPEATGGSAGREEMALVDAGPFVMGTDDRSWAYDNERPAFEVDVPAFWIDTSPVANGAYAEFIETDGYHDPRWWTGPGWAWRTEADLTHPEFWRPATNGWERRRLGRWELVPSDEPVQHVCWYEADAYARWACKRLPTEAEWEKAVSWDASAQAKRRFPWGDDEPTSALANLAYGPGLRSFGPEPVGSHPLGVSPWGCHQMAGDVWEWTASDFAPYPGFEPFPYREYSEVFFGPEYKVLRGGSWAAHPSVAARVTFRNWDYPIRRQIFAGFRCARDA